MAKASSFLSTLAAVACVAALAFFLPCCGSKSGGVDVHDDTYPSSVSDLRVKSVSAGTVTLEWTAPGDNGTAGTAAQYDMRCSRSEITWQNWDSVAVQPLPGEPKPSAAGSTDTMRVTGLMADSTYYFALKTRGHSGNWSWLSNCVNAIAFNDFEVTFTDPNLDQVVRAAINKPTGAIHRSDLLPVQFIDASNHSVTSLAGLEHCVNLQAIYLWKNNVSDLSPLAGLVKLRSIQAGQNQISNVSALAALVNIEQLYLDENTITDISALAAMSRLSDVNLSGNSITSIASLAGKPALTALNLYSNSVSDISALAASTSLEHLNLWKNNIPDIGALSGMTKLKDLYLNQNQISDVSALSNLTQVQGLYLGNNPISNISVLANLTSLTELSLQSCQVVDVTPLQGLVNLQKLVLYYNQVVDIAPLVANSGLGAGDLLYLGGNPLSQQSLNTYIPALVARGVLVYM